MVKATATTLTESNSDLPTTTEHQTTNSLTSDFTSSPKPENTYQASNQTLTLSNSNTRQKGNIRLYFCSNGMLIRKRTILLLLEKNIIYFTNHIITIICLDQLNLDTLLMQIKKLINELLLSDLN